MRIIPQFIRSRRKLILWVALGFAIPLSFPAWVLLRSPDGIEISKETTFVVSPLNENGEVDLSVEINRLRLGESDGNATIDPSAIDAAAKKLRAACRPFWTPGKDTAEEIHEAIPDFQARLNEFFATLRANDGVLLAPPFSSETRLADLGRDFEVLFREQRFYGVTLSYMLSAKLTVALKEGDNEQQQRTLAEIVTLQSFLLRQLTVFSGVCVYQTREDLLQAIAQQIKNVDFCRQPVHELPTISDVELLAMMRCDRLFEISAILLLHAGTESTQQGLLGAPTLVHQGKARVADRWLRGRVDWNEVLRDRNREWDAAEASIFGEAESRSAADALTNPMVTNRDRQDWWSREGATATMLRFWGRTASRYPIADSIRDMQRRRELINAATYVVEYWQQNNRFPDSLADAGYDSTTNIPFQSHAKLGEVSYSEVDGERVLSIGEDAAVVNLRILVNDGITATFKAKTGE